MIRTGHPVYIMGGTGTVSELESGLQLAGRVMLGCYTPHEGKSELSDFAREQFSIGGQSASGNELSSLLTLMKINGYDDEVEEALVYPKLEKEPPNPWLEEVCSVCYFLSQATWKEAFPLLFGQFP